MTAPWRRRCASGRRFEASIASSDADSCRRPCREGSAHLKFWLHLRSRAVLMPLACKASRFFVPPFPRRPNKPRGALSLILALRRNPIEIWSEGDFERPVSLGRSVLGLRGAAHDPAAVRRIFLDNASN